MPIDMSQFQESFFEEVAEHLDRLESLIVKIETGISTREDFDALFRTAHSIKGASGTFGFVEMAELTHFLESALDRLRDGSLPVSSAVVDCVLLTGDVLRRQLANYRSGEVPDATKASQARSALQTLLGAKRDETPAPAQPSPSTQTHLVVFEAEREAGARSVIFESMQALLADLGRCTREASPERIFRCSFTGTQSQEELEDLFAFILEDGDTLSISPAEGEAEAFGFFDEPENETEVRAAEPAPESAGEGSSVRVKLQKLDTLINLVGELLIAQSALEERSLRLDPVEHGDLHMSINDLQRHTRDIRESVMSIRMLPIGSIFNRFPRMVRQLSAQLNKDVVLTTNGGDTELDKGLIESIVDPLTHLIRNSIDHGIEERADRSNSGKPKIGSVHLSSYQRNGNVHVEVRDDGSGMNRERILAKAEAQGIRTWEGMSDRDVWALVCAPGFSTAEKVTDISGRGVGMDVVKRNIQQLGGAVEIDSLPGKGTTISLILPLTLAIMDGLAVSVAGDVCIIPMSSIVESTAIQSADIISPADGPPFIMYRGEALPLIAAPGHALDTSDMNDRIVVVVEADSRAAGLVVDALENEHQVVAKSLEANFRKVEGFSGATILGNGKVALILDVASLVCAYQPVSAHPA